MTELEKKALSCLPVRLSDAVIRSASLWNSPINEIRLRENRLLSVTVGQHNVSCGLNCTREEILYTVSKVCGNSLYSHSESIREGCITMDCGIRVGVCGHAVVTDGRVTLVRDITSMNIRIPHRISGIANKLYERMDSNTSVLIYSRPGMGKTTLLRELIPHLSSGERPKRVAVIDTRYELCAGVPESDMADVFYGYPRYEGILSAIRTMSPEYIICDEISTERDVAAMMYAHSSGIAVCASVHAGSIDELNNIPIIGSLSEAHVFDLICGINSEDYDIKDIKNGVIFCD